MSKLINVVIPIAGRAQRFIDCGYLTPKPLILVDGVPMIKLAIDSLIKNRDKSSFKLIFIVRDDHCVNYHINIALLNLFEGWNIEVISIDGITNGTLCTCMLAESVIDLDMPLVVYTPDVCFDSDFSIIDDFVAFNALDGLVLTFKANSPDHSYAASDSSLLVTKTAEKKVISNDAIVGVYCFRSGAQFLKYANLMVDNNITTNGEFYVAPIYNLMIQDTPRASIGIYRIDRMYVLGTPEDLKFYEFYVARNAEITTLAICCDHSGYDLKLQIISYIKNNLPNIKVLDFGCHTRNDSDHYDSLRPCAEYILNHSNTIGIGICHTGQGFNIAANKVSHIRSALVHDAHTAAMCRKHNAANFVCIPSMYVSIDYFGLIINSIINSQFDGGRHSTRIQKLLRDDFFGD